MSPPDHGLRLSDWGWVADELDPRGFACLNAGNHLRYGCLKAVVLLDDGTVRLVMEPQLMHPHDGALDIPVSDWVVDDGPPVHIRQDEEFVICHGNGAGPFLAFGEGDINRIYLKSFPW